MSLKRDPGIFFLTVLAVVCALPALRAQNFIAAPERQNPRLITNRKELNSLTLEEQPPEYPPVAKVNYLEGLVQIQISVNSRGRVLNAHVLKGNAVLASAALKAVKHWIYRPLAVAGGPAGFDAIVKVKFVYRHPGISLTSREAERDFLRQVKPPRVVTPPKQLPGDNVVHMRLLVNDEGQVVDRDSSNPDKAQFEAACENLRRWSFEPAHWGTIPIASYVDVDVPIGPQTVARATASIGAR